MVEVSAKEARRILRALRSGVVPDVELAQGIFVGQSDWFRTAAKMMDENAEDEDFEVRFVRARYGGGKTLFLRRLEYEANQKNWATAYVLLRHGKVELDKVHTFANELAEQIRVGDEGRGLSALLKSGILGIGRQCGFEPGKTSSGDTHERVLSTLSNDCASRGFSYDLTIALRSAARAIIGRSEDRVQLIARWLGGGQDKLPVPARHVGNGNPGSDIFLKPLGIGAAEELIRLMAVLVQWSGRPGLFVALDEVELIGTLPAKRRANAFQTLRALVDRKDIATQPPATSLFLAATPQMFEDPQMFPSYKALQDRIEKARPIGPDRRVNYKSPVVDLDATELGEPELLAVGRLIVELNCISGEPTPADMSRQLKEIVKAVATKHYVVARPRLLCRAVMDALDGQLGTDVEQSVAALNEEEIKKRTAEMNPGDSE